MVKRWFLLLVMAFVSLQLFFALSVAGTALLPVETTSFQRSEAWRLMRAPEPMQWRQQWLPYDQISDQLKRAVIASEDGSFIDHDGMNWDAIESAWQRNAAAMERAENNPRATPPRLRGGSTITQQLAKNLLLSSERTFLRKAQEFAITLTLEAVLSKQRILELYLNNVEWGSGVFGAEAAARHYFGVSAGQLSAVQAARLAVMLPAPKRFEKNPHSAYLNGRTRTILARMRSAELP